MTSEPFEIAQQGGFKPNVFLLADYGYSTYSTLIVTRREIVEKNPDLVQRFVDASAIGWYHYLYGDNSKAQRADQTGQSGHHRRPDRLLDRQDEGYGIVDSGDTLKARDRRDDRRPRRLSHLAAACRARSRDQSHAAQPIDATAAHDSVFLALNATGLAGITSKDRSYAEIGGTTVPVVSIAADANTPGIERVTLGPLPVSLANRGLLDVLIAVDGISANPVQVFFGPPQGQ